tara:strand:- start:1057 stop:1599 length:543 start_codon:yes stop_codon:yes gene_type:complete
MKKHEAFLMRNKHKHNDKDDFRTPPYLFAYIEKRYGKIDFDGACTPDVNNLAAPLRLEDEWPVGATIYSNPPFDSESITKWVKKGRKHALNGGTHIMLLPDKLTQCFFAELFPMIQEIIFLGGRVNFVSPYAVKGGASMSGSIIIAQKQRVRLPRDLTIIAVDNVLIRDLKKQYNEGVNS